MKNILITILVGLSISSFAQLPTTGGKKNLSVDDAITDTIYGIDFAGTYFRNFYTKINPANDNVKSNWKWYFSKAGAINTASDPTQQIDQSIQGWDYPFNLNLWDYDSVAIDTAIDTVMVKYATNKLTNKYGATNFEYDLYGFTVLDTINFSDKDMDSVYIVVKFIEFMNNDDMRAVFKWYLNKDAYLAGYKPINSYNWYRNYTIPEFKPSINDWTFEFRKVWKGTPGYPDTNLGYTIESW